MVYVLEVIIFIFLILFYATYKAHKENKDTIKNLNTKFENATHAQSLYHDSYIQIRRSNADLWKILSNHKIKRDLKSIAKEVVKYDKQRGKETAKFIKRENARIKGNAIRVT